MTEQNKSVEYFKSVFSKLTRQQQEDNLEFFKERDSRLHDRKDQIKALKELLGN